MEGQLEALCLLLACLACVDGAHYDFSASLGGLSDYAQPIKCQQGFRSDDVGGCIDDDECRHTRLHCGSNSACFNTIGSFVCICRPGFVKNDKGQCVDVDECVRGGAQCSVHELCVNQVGSYGCYCKAGYRRDARRGCMSVTGNQNDGVSHMFPFLPDLHSAQMEDTSSDSSPASSDSVSDMSPSSPDMYSGQTENTHSDSIPPSSGGQRDGFDVLKDLYSQFKEKTASNNAPPHAGEATTPLESMKWFNDDADESDRYRDDDDILNLDFFFGKNSPVMKLLRRA